MLPKMEWMEKTYTAFPNCFFQHCREEARANDDVPIYRTCLISIYGEILLLCDSGESVMERRVNLKDYLPQGSSESDSSHRTGLSISSGPRPSNPLLQSMSSLPLSTSSKDGSRWTQLEIVAIDAREETKERVPGKVLVVTCWGETCETGTTSRYTLALFRVEMHTGKTSLLAKEELARSLAVCKFFQYRTRKDSFGVLLFPTNDKAELHEIQATPDGGFSLNHRNDIEREYAELCQEPMPGTVVRMVMETIGRFRWTLVGCDNGHLLFWRVTLNGGVITLVKHMRFFGAVSILDIYQPYKDYGDVEDEEDEPTVHVIVSSTLGPVGIYRVVQYHDNRVSWERRALLNDSTTKDTVIVAARHGDFLVIGFYSQFISTYNLKKVLELPPTHAILPAHSIVRVNSPLAALKFLGPYDLSVITFAGHHHLMTIEDEEEDDDLDEEDDYN